MKAKTPKQEPARHKPTTPTERGDGDYEGSASSLAHQNAPREKKYGQGRDKTTTTGKAEPVRTRGVEDD